MLRTGDFGAELKKLGFDFFAGVPCSFLKPLINYAINECDYVAAVNEGDAVAMAAGAYLGGRKPVVLMQNSGLGNAVSPLTSLNQIFRIPVLGFVSLRGQQGCRDEPQHELMGKITTDLLELMGIEWEYLSADMQAAELQLQTASETVGEGESFFFVVRKNTFDPEPLGLRPQRVGTESAITEKSGDDELPKRSSVLSAVREFCDQNTALVATTGYTGRELYESGDVENNFYMIGSMGCASSLGLGLALAAPEKDIVVIDGDGALLMRLGALASNGYYGPPNLMHILLDNNVYESTGGQETVSSNVDFVRLAASAGCRNSVHISNVEGLKKCILGWKTKKAHTFAYMKISRGVGEDLGRPSQSPEEFRARFMEFVNG